MRSRLSPTLSGSAVDAGEGELLADPRGVGVDDLAEQQLGADGHDLAAHGRHRSDLGDRAATGDSATVAAAAGDHVLDARDQVSTTAAQSDALASQAWSSAIGGSSAKPTATACTTVFTLASCRAGTASPAGPSTTRKPGCRARARR